MCTYSLLTVYMRKDITDNAKLVACFAPYYKYIARALLQLYHQAYIRKEEKIIIYNQAIND